MPSQAPLRAVFVIFELREAQWAYLEGCFKICFIFVIHTSPLTFPYLENLAGSLVHLGLIGWKVQWAHLAIWYTKR